MGDFDLAMKEIDPDEDHMKKIIEAAEKMQGFQMITPYYQPSMDPTDSNIVFSCAKVISGYNQETFEPQIAASSESRLLAFSQRTNSEIAIGYVRNSVYNSIAQGDPQFTTTYFPIGDPPIMVSVNSNSEDPYGDFWKCKHGNMGADIDYTIVADADYDAALEELSTDMSVQELDSSRDIDEGSGDDPGDIANDRKNVIIITTDDVRYCMPFTQCTLIAQKRTNKINNYFSDNFNAYSKGFKTPANTYLDPVTREYLPSGEGKVNNSILPFQNWVNKVYSSNALYSFNIPFPSSLVDSMVLDPSKPDDPYGAQPTTFLSVFRDDELKNNYKARQLPRENEYKVTYNVVEKEALQRRFGQEFSLSDTLNNIYIGLATFLATTFIEVAYTFKKVEAPKLTPEQITPANLAFTDGTVVLDPVGARGIDEVTTSGYYPSDYVDSYGSERYREPSPPTGGFYDSDYYSRMSGIVYEETEEYGGDLDDFRDALESGPGDSYI